MVWVSQHGNDKHHLSPPLQTGQVATVNRLSNGSHRPVGCVNLEHHLEQVSMVPPSGPPVTLRML